MHLHHLTFYLRVMHLIGALRIINPDAGHKKLVHTLAAKQPFPAATFLTNVEMNMPVSPYSLELKGQRPQRENLRIIDACPGKNILYILCLIMHFHYQTVK